MSLHRRQKLEEEIRQALVEIFLFEIEDVRLQKIRVTRVRLTGDLGLARVYYEVPEDTGKKEMESALEKAGRFLRKGLARRLNVRLMPQIGFFYDETKKEIERVEELFSKV